MVPNDECTFPVPNIPSAHRICPQSNLPLASTCNYSSLQIGSTVDPITRRCSAYYITMAKTFVLILLSDYEERVFLLRMDDPSLQPININILHNIHNTHTAQYPHNTEYTSLKSSFRKRSRIDTTVDSDKKRVTFPSEGPLFEYVVDCSYARCYKEGEE
jgi:hypothetical protein